MKQTFSKLWINHCSRIANHLIEIRTSECVSWIIWFRSGHVPKSQSEMMVHESLFKLGLQCADRETFDLERNFGAGSHIIFGTSECRAWIIWFKPETHCTIFSCPRWKIGIVKKSWWFLWSWLLIGGPVSYSESGSKTAVVTILWPKILWEKIRAHDNFLTVSD